MDYNAITVSIEHEHSRLFEKLSYRTFSPIALRANGKFIITRSGLVWPSVQLSRLLSYRGIRPEYLGTAISLGSILIRGSGKITSDSPVGIIHSIWSAGYYHWMTESLPRAMVLRDQFPDAVPVLPSSKYDSYKDSLRAIGFPSVLKFPDDQNLSVSDPVLTSCPSKYATTSPDLLRAVSSEILRYFNLELASEPKRIVYVSRKRARGRIVLNEDEIMHELHDIGIESICFEDLSFYGQVELMSQTKILIGIHGAGLANMMFMPKNGAVVEILPARNGIFDYNVSRNSFLHDPCYVRLADTFCLGHRAIICEHDREFWQKTHMANVVVRSSTLRNAIESLRSAREL